MALSRLRQFGIAASVAAASFGANLSPANDFEIVSKASAQAASQCLPGVYDESRPVQGGDCYSASEFNRAMRAEGQQPVIVGNRDAGSYRYGEYFTSNADGSKGVNAEMDVPYENKAAATSVSVRAVYTGIRINDVNASNLIPAWANINGNVLDINQSTNKDARIMMLAHTVHNPTANGQWRLGQSIVIFRDMNTGRGYVDAVNSSGALTPLAVMEPVGYTQFASRMMVQQNASAEAPRSTELASLSPAAN